MRVFVTGGTGFIGQHVVAKLLNDNHKVALLIRRNTINSDETGEQLTIINGDLSKIDTWKNELANFEPDACIHLAWEGIPDYGYRYSIKNLFMSLNLFNILVENSCKKIITAGTCWEYNKKRGKIKENTNINPKKPFIAAKHSIHVMGRELAKENDMDFIWTRFFYVYGPGQNEHSLIPYIINSIKSRKKPNIKTPYSRNDFIYVEDLAKALSDVLKKGKGTVIYNIGSGYSTEIKDIIDMVYYYNNISKKYIPDIDIPKRSDLIDFYADISLINKEISWKPHTTIKQGIKKTVEFMIDK